MQEEFREEYIPVFYNIGDDGCLLKVRDDRHVFGSFIRLCRADPERLFRKGMSKDLDDIYGMSSFLGLKQEFWHCIDMHGVLWCVGRCLDTNNDACTRTRGYAWPGLFIDDTRVNLGLRDLVEYMNGGDEMVCRHIDRETFQTLYDFDVRTAQNRIVADMRCENRTFCDGCLECFDYSPAKMVYTVRNDNGSHPQKTLCRICITRLIKGESTITKQWYNYAEYHVSQTKASSQLLSEWKAYRTSMQRLKKYTNRSMQRLKKYTNRSFILKKYTYE